MFDAPSKRARITAFTSPRSTEVPADLIDIPVKSKASNSLQDRYVTQESNSLADIFIGRCRVQHNGHSILASQPGNQDIDFHGDLTLDRVFSWSITMS